MPEIPWKASVTSTEHKKQSITPTLDRKFLDPGAPTNVLSSRRRRRQIVRDAVADYVADTTTLPHQRAAARSWLKHLDRLIKIRPDTTSCGMISITARRMSIWIYEAELAGPGDGVQVILDSSPALARALLRLRAAQTV